MLRGAKPGRATRRPGPGEVVASDRTKSVEYFTAQKQAGMAPALESPRVHVVECDATAGDIGLLVSLVAGPWQDERCESFQQRRSFAAVQLGGSPIGRDVDLPE